MVIKWSDSVNIREPWRKGHSIFAAPSRGAGGEGGGRSRRREPLRHVWVCPPCRGRAPEVGGRIRRRAEAAPDSEDTRTETIGQKWTTPGRFPAAMMATNEPPALIR